VGLEVTRAGSSHTAPPAQEVRRGFALSEARGVSVIGEADGEPVVPIEERAAVLELQGHAPVLGAGLGDAIPAPRVELQVPGEGGGGGGRDRTLASSWGKSVGVSARQPFSLRTLKPSNQSNGPRDPP